MINFTVLIFDLDGTLVDSYPGIHASLNHALRELSLPEVSLADVKRMVGKGIHNLLLQAVGPDKVEAGIALFRESYDETHLSGTLLLPEVPETLATLQSRGIKMAVASNKPPDYTESILQHLQLMRFFEAFAGPGPQIPIKPD